MAVISISNNKRGREDDGEVERLAMQNCMKLGSRIGLQSSLGRLFSCKTCNRQFNSFQALGGHRASHKKPRLFGTTGDLSNSPRSPVKPKTHECPICGQEFAIGQALGGHMRRHRVDMINKKLGTVQEKTVQKAAGVVPVLKKSSSKRVLNLDLDLNLTPYENDLKLGYQMANLTPYENDLKLGYQMAPLLYRFI